MSTVIEFGPGIMRALPYELYQRVDAASHSRLSRLLRSPAHLRAYLDSPAEPTAALNIGRALHLAVFESDLFAAQYRRDIEGDGRTKAVREARAAERLEHPESEFLSPGDFDGVLAMRETVFAHPTVRQLAEAGGDSEVSAFWYEPVEGGDPVFCKGRMDRTCPRFGTVIDLKSTRDASAREFERAIWTYRNYAQAALYLDGANVTHEDAEFEHFVNVCVEKEPPYAVAVYRIREDAIEAGGRENYALLRRYRQCVETNEWPGYPVDVQDISLPPYAWDVSDRRAGGIFQSESEEAA